MTSSNGVDENNIYMLKVNSNTSPCLTGDHKWNNDAIKVTKDVDN